MRKGADDNGGWEIEDGGDTRMFVIGAVVAGCMVADSLAARWEERIEEPCVNHILARQEIVWPLTGDTTRRLLEIWFVPPSRFRACYGAPDSQVVVADGAWIRTYVPDNHQVLVQRQAPDLTWRDSPLGDFLKVDPATTDVDTVREGRRGRLRTWVDTTGAAPYPAIEVFVPEGEGWPSAARLVDVSGNATTYTVLRWERTRISDGADRLFALDLPPGVDAVSID
ncbi:MAG: outer membrane lipoprotein carrier protein LolA [Candidatus Eisenbacteria bacterium]|jgi:outer membrane lipoprotein-sorting protein|nr:outer membrane lipoprotein carrier protein LolA [Candidatus Eisenbacteria bacterium]